MNIYLVIFITLVAALIASFAQILYKKGVHNKVSGLKSAVAVFKNKTVLLGLVGYIISLAIYLYALSNAQLSIVYPTFASTFIFIAIFSTFMLREKFSRTRSAGVLLVFLGIVIIALSIG